MELGLHFFKAQRWLTGKRIRRKQRERNDYGNIQSLQRSPKKGIPDPADALSASTREGRSAGLTHSYRGEIEM